MLGKQPSRNDTVPSLPHARRSRLQVPRVRDVWSVGARPEVLDERTGRRAETAGAARVARGAPGLDAVEQQPEDAAQQQKEAAAAERGSNESRDDQSRVRGWWWGVVAACWHCSTETSCNR